MNERNGRLNRISWDTVLFGVWTVIGLAVLWISDPLDRKLDADASFMLYAGQEILRGHAPYVGVAIVKLPVSPILAALGIAIGRVFRMDDLVAGRVAFWLCAGLTVGATYLIGTQLVKPSSVFRGSVESPTSKVWGILLGSLSAIVLLSSQALGLQVAEGPEAKLPMICAGLFCVVFAARRQFFWAGVLGSISFMAWQPGLIFVAAALLCSIIVPERKRALPLALAGAAIPIVLIGGYLLLNGALGSMFNQAFGANADYFQEKKVGTGFLSMIFANVGKVWDVSLECSDTQVPLTWLGYLGLIGGAVFLVWRVIPHPLDASSQRLAEQHPRLDTSPLSRRARGDSPPLQSLSQWARGAQSESQLAAIMLLVSGAGLFGFSFLDLQKCSDIVPLLPYAALGTGAVLAAVAFVMARLVTPRLNMNETRGLGAVGAVVIGLTFVYGVHQLFAVPPQPGTLAQQRELAQELSSELTSTDRVQQFGDAVFLVITGRENATRYVHLGEKQGLGIITAENISMDDLIAELRVADPRMITLSRAKDKDWAQPLYGWIEANYSLEDSYGATDGGTVKATDVYVRKEN